MFLVDDYRVIEIGQFDLADHYLPMCLTINVRFSVMTLLRRRWGLWRAELRLKLHREWDVIETWLRRDETWWDVIETWLHTICFSPLLSPFTVMALVPTVSHFSIKYTFKYIWEGVGWGWGDPPSPPISYAPGCNKSNVLTQSTTQGFFYLLRKNYRSKFFPYITCISWVRSQL